MKIKIYYSGKHQEQGFYEEEEQNAKELLKLSNWKIIQQIKPKKVIK